MKLRGPSSFTLAQPSRKGTLARTGGRGELERPEVVPLGVAERAEEPVLAPKPGPPGGRGAGPGLKSTGDADRSYFAMEHARECGGVVRLVPCYSPIHQREWLVTVRVYTLFVARAPSRPVSRTSLS